MTFTKNVDRETGVRIRYGVRGGGPGRGRVGGGFDEGLPTKVM